MKNSLHQTAFLNTPQFKRIFSTTVGNFAVRNPYLMLCILYILYIPYIRYVHAYLHTSIVLTTVIPTYIHKWTNTYLCHQLYILSVCTTTKYIHPYVVHCTFVYLYKHCLYVCMYVYVYMYNICMYIIYMYVQYMYVRICTYVQYMYMCICIYVRTIYV